MTLAAREEGDLPRIRWESEIDVEVELEARVALPRARAMMPSALPWDQAMFQQMMRELGVPPARSAAQPPLPRPLALRPPVSRAHAPRRPRPNVFQVPATPLDPPPPWVKEGRSQRRAREKRVREEQAAVATAGAKAAPAKSSRTRWLLFLLAFLLGFGLAQDRPTRTRIVALTRAHGLVAWQATVSGLTKASIAVRAAAREL